MNCLICGKKLVKNKKYCSKECSYQKLKGTKRPEVGVKIAKALKGINHSEERKENISQGRYDGYIKNYGILSEEDFMIIDKYFEEGYTSDFISIMEHEFPERNKYLLNNFLKHNKNYLDKFNIKKFNPTKVQKWNLKKWLEFKDDCLKLHFKKICEKYNLLDRCLIRLANKHNIELIGTSVKDKKMTGIEKIIFDYLTNNNFNFKREVYLNGYLNKNNKKVYKYRIDFIINDNICIEVNGDYWHVNPRIYLNEHIILDSKLKRNIINDYQKKLWLLHNKYRLFIIWEKDLIENPLKCWKELDYFIKSDLKFRESYYN